MFATLAIKLEFKCKAPNAHTFLEATRARHGIYGHTNFMGFGLFTNILYAMYSRGWCQLMLIFFHRVTAMHMLLTRGGTVITSLTGMPTAAASFLLPVGVIIYIMFGDIK